MFNWELPMPGEQWLEEIYLAATRPSVRNVMDMCTDAGRMLHDPNSPVLYRWTSGRGVARSNAFDY